MLRRLILPLLALAVALPAAAEDVAASPPSALSVTVYRAPYRGEGSIDLDDLGGFALISETRTVHVPAGVNRLRFEGVADGIDAATAIVTGLPGEVIEKNRDAALLSPSALIEASFGRAVALVRTNAATGERESVPGKIVSDAGGGVVFESAEGVEALRCSGLSETFHFALATPGLSARPTLSVTTRSDRPVDATVTLSYLARGFDWSADYVATLSRDGKTLDLGAWVTLANGNGTGFPHANTNVVAGRLNKETDEIEPIDIGRPILARCWPQGTTSDVSSGMLVAYRAGVPPPPPPPPPPAPMAPMALQEMVVTARKVVQEQLGDLKLYRVPEPTTVASRQSKQVRLLDRSGIPVERIYTIDIGANDTRDYQPADVVLRTKNDAAHHLGLALPSGQVAVFDRAGSRSLLVGEAGIDDTTIDEEVEIALGPAPDVQVRQTIEERQVDQEHAETLALVPGVVIARTVPVSRVARIDLSNTGARPASIEVRLALDPSQRVVRADHLVGRKNGRPVFRVALPANGSATIRYQTQAN
ncbi:MAG TPA: hypothetical protein VM657_02610 [Sphingomonas sp.]|nr:hypothetical protein [Sphingomonas sp.]